MESAAVSAERAGETIPAKFHPSKSFLTAENRPKKVSSASRARTSGGFADRLLFLRAMPKCFWRHCLRCVSARFEYCARDSGVRPTIPRTAVVIKAVIGASLSEPHLVSSTAALSIYLFIYLYI